jgi:hypothetical protein
MSDQHHGKEIEGQWFPDELLSNSDNRVTNDMTFDLPFSWKSHRYEHLFTLIKANKYSFGTGTGGGETNKSPLYPYEITPFCRCHQTSNRCDENCENYQLYMSSFFPLLNPHSLIGNVPRIIV